MMGNFGIGFYPTGYQSGVAVCTCLIVTYAVYGPSIWLFFFSFPQNNTKTQVRVDMQILSLRPKFHYIEIEFVGLEFA